jgi:peptidoglycan glycosyltransferase
VRSCNTTFGQIGLDLGDPFVPGMERFGMNQLPPLDLDPGAVASVGPQFGTYDQNKPLFAFAGIGQGDVAVTPLEMAMAGAAVANGGVVMIPHVMASVTDAKREVVRTYRSQAWKTAMTPQTADVVEDFMRQVVARGTGTAARIPGVTVAGKTGTAQTVDGADPHAWFVGYAPAGPADTPRFAVAVLVEHGGSLGSEATGGAVAAPIAGRMLAAALGVG